MRLLPFIIVALVPLALAIGVIIMVLNGIDGWVWIIVGIILSIPSIKLKNK